jgi:hypothetical protein
VGYGLAGALLGLSLLALPCLLFRVWRFWQVQLLGPGCVLRGSTTEQASHASGRESGHDSTAAE